MLTALAHVTAELSTATTIDEVTKIVTQQMADAVGATIAALALREGEDHIRIIGVRGLEAPEAAQWQVFPLDSPNTVTDTVRHGRRIVLVGADEITRRYPELARTTARGERTTITVPLRAAGRVLGAIHLSVPEGTEPHPTALEFIDILADACAQAFERIAAQALADKQTARLAFIAEASIQLSSSLDFRVTAARVSRLAVPTYADWCAIDIVRDGRPHRVAAAHVDPAKADLALRFHERRSEAELESSPMMRVVRTGRPVLLAEITDAMMEEFTDDAEHLELARELGLRSALAVPLLVRGRVSGVLTWVSSDPLRHYDEDDVRFAEHLARRAASALDNADLFSQTRAVAEQLQRAVLPGALRSSPEWTAHCHYVPSGRTEVGGDFYDAFSIGDGRFVAFVGDVMGRGVAAAAAMAQMRSAVRAFASVEPDPVVVVEKLDRMVTRFDTEQLVTLAYVLADAGRGVVDVVNAGHLPPRVLRSSGELSTLPIADGPPLGLAERRTPTTVPFTPGDTLVIVTDGLVERRGESIDDGLARLDASIGDLADADLEEGLERLVSDLADTESDDDVAALVLRRTEPGVPPRV
jgi:serine phosphatase RsbU (regulator of sigma subunit)